jgi:hypothetical protein
MRISGRAACSVLLALVGAAAADPNKEVAERTFARGRDLMAQKKYAEACAAFEQSERLDPQFGTEFNLAACEVELGKLAAAWSLYHELARSDTKPARRQASSDLAEKLDARVPRLVVEIPERVAGLAVAIDGADSTSLVGVEVRVDLGEHTIAVTAPGFRDEHRTARTSHEGEIRTVTIHLRPAGAGPSPPPPPRVVAHVEPSPRGRYGKYAMLGGGVVIAGGLVVGALAVSTWHDAQSCTSCDRPTVAHRAVVLGNVSTVLVVAGVVPVAAGLYLWRTAGSSATVVPQASSDGAGLAVVGTF